MNGPLMMVHLVHKEGGTLIFNLRHVRAIETYHGADPDLKTHISFMHEDPGLRGFRTSISVKKISDAIKFASREFMYDRSIYSIVVEED